MPRKNSRQPEGNEAELAQTLAEVERSLHALNERYQQVKRDSEIQTQLLQRQQELQQQPRPVRNSPEIKAELAQIQQELDTIELNLESSLFSWDSLKEPFWQAVRFGGLGVVIGWLLKSCAG
ncbi:DUF2203 domain-containing protein [Oscillatoria salina]|uniref:DUF2203 domain-containing protein n=1 Tax=Oscillatoria salina TaxID=331517 RepID=UPI0013B6CD07|nr:DUF2203 domain-containing protein [Oscillatoria salina]MBZ8180314.1 DUF2203 domain-containing protein [Oscillatoria salina IIICB1]NET88380.1 DUF2203 domain-containing protein [Kamptonema sp. SIO1D9]